MWRQSNAHVGCVLCEHVRLQVPRGESRQVNRQHAERPTVRDAPCHDTGALHSERLEPGLRSAVR